MMLGLVLVWMGEPVTGDGVPGDLVGPPRLHGPVPLQPPLTNTLCMGLQVVMLLKKLICFI